MACCMWAWEVGTASTADWFDIVDIWCWQGFMACDSLLCSQLGWSTSSWHRFTQQFISKVILYSFIAVQSVLYMYSVYRWLWFGPAGGLLPNGCIMLHFVVLLVQLVFGIVLLYTILSLLAYSKCKNLHIGFVKLLYFCRNFKSINILQQCWLDNMKGIHPEKILLHKSERFAFGRLVITCNSFGKLSCLNKRQNY